MIRGNLSAGCVLDFENATVGNGPGDDFKKKKSAVTVIRVYKKSPCRMAGEFRNGAAAWVGADAIFACRLWEEALPKHIGRRIRIRASRDTHSAVIPLYALAEVAR